jgi:hypothetical protein
MNNKRKMKKIYINYLPQAPHRDNRTNGGKTVHRPWVGLEMGTLRGNELAKAAQQ